MSARNDSRIKSSRASATPSKDAYAGGARNPRSYSTQEEMSINPSRMPVRYRLAGYVRLSPSDEIREEGSLVSHPQRIKSFVDFKNTQEAGWGAIVEWYVDKDYSGKDTNRPAFRRLLQDVKAGVVNAVIVTELSRLSRDVKDFCQFWEFLKHHGATFFSLKESFDTSTPIGEMMVINCISFAQFERKTIVQRIKDGARARAERGLANGRAPVLGYDPDATKRHHLIINEAEAPVVRMMFAKFIELGSVRQLRDHLNATGCRTKAYVTQDGRSVGGRLWTEATIYNLLTNLKYVAKVEINRHNRAAPAEHLREHERYKRVDATWPAIIEPQIFDRVQEILESNRRFHKVHKHVYRLSGLLTCGACGDELVGISANGKGGKYFWLCPDFPIAESAETT